MFAQILSALFPVKLPKKITKDEWNTSASFIYRVHAWDGRNANITAERSEAAGASRMSAITYAPSLRQYEIDREITIREAYTSNLIK